MLERPSSEFFQLGRNDQSFHSLALEQFDPFLRPQHV